MGLQPNELLIHDGNHNGQLDLIVTQGLKTGLIPRDYSKHPQGYAAAAPASTFPLVPESEWSARIKEMEETKSRVSDILLAQGIPSLDQNGYGYCWAHSTVGAVMASRAISNQPYVPLSAYAVAAIIKNYQDEGGWNTQSLDFVRNVGVPSQSFWPQGVVKRSLDTPVMRANALLHRVTEWFDGSEDRELNFKLAMSYALNRIPFALDLNWWSHSVMGCDGVEVEPGSFGLRFRNSWGDQYGKLGFSVLTGSKAIPDGISAPVVSGASPI